MESRYCINYLLTIFQHEVFQTFFSRLSPYGITPGQYDVLNCLWKNGPTTPKEIIRMFRLENSTVSGILDRMQEQDLIDWVADSNNRCGILAVATPSAMTMKDGVLKTANELSIEILQDLTLQEKDALMESLCRIDRIDEEERMMEPSGTDRNLIICMKQAPDLSIG